MQQPQAAAAFFMVEPTSFDFDTQTAATNGFQHHVGTTAEITSAALREFHAYVAALQAEDIDVRIFRDPSDAVKPDAVFPNNWFTTWPDGTVYLYPMATPIRRQERSEAAIALLRTNYQVKQVIDLSRAEMTGNSLEGTGALVFDHPSRTMYACISSRCDASLVHEHAQQLGYAPVIFSAILPDGAPIYHTNVLLSIQSSTAVLYERGITDDIERARVIAALTASGKQIIDITLEQLQSFCANILMVHNRQHEPFIVLSERAYNSFRPEQLALLSRSGKPLRVSIPTIETIGGGGARCMLAELFLPSLPIHDVA